MSFTLASAVVRIYNKGSRRFHYGKDVSDFIDPVRFKDVPADIAAKLLADYPNELVTAEDQDRHAAAHAGEIAAKEAALAAEKKANAEKDAEIARLRAQLENLGKLTQEPTPFSAPVDAPGEGKRGPGRPPKSDAGK